MLSLCYCDSSTAANVLSVLSPLPSFFLLESILQRNCRSLGTASLLQSLQGCMCVWDEDSAHNFGTQKLDFGFEFGLVYWMSSYPEFGHFPHSWSGTGFAGQQDFLPLSVKSHVRLPQYHRSIFLEVSLGKFRVYSMRNILAMEWKHPWAWGKIGCFLWRTQSACIPTMEGKKGNTFLSWCLLLPFSLLKIC